MEKKKINQLKIGNQPEIAEGERKFIQNCQKTKLRNCQNNLMFLGMLMKKLNNQL